MTTTTVLMIECHDTHLASDYENDIEMVSVMLQERESRAVDTAPTSS